MARFVKYSLLLVVLNVTCWAQVSLSLAVQPHGTPRAVSSQPSSTDNGIQYHGGSVMNQVNGVNVYLIWYGNWSNNTEPAIVTDFINDIGGTAYFNITSSYYDFNKFGGGVKDPVVNRVNFGGSITDNYSLGTNLSDNDVGNIVGFAIGLGAPVGYPKLPEDPNGVYLVLGSKDVTEQSIAPLGPFCAWHSYGFALKGNSGAGVPIKVGFISSSDEDPSFCQIQNPSPNNNPAADDAARAIAHELAETVTDPLYNGWWRTSDGLEMGDLCERIFGNTKLLPNGSSYNLQFGTRLYLVQKLWVNARGGYCALALDE